MDDRELLELAALAVGYEGRYIFRAGGRKGSGWPYDIVGFERVGGAMWNPLNNDGDALRLAVALEIELSFINGDTHADGQSEGGADKPRNTRRAITRAAAEIGRSREK